MIFFDKSEAYRAAKAVMQKGYGYYRIRAAVFVLKKSKSEEAERLMIDYLINHDNNDINKTVVLSYWD